MLPFPMVPNLVQNAYPNASADDAWFSSYLKSCLKPIFQNPSEFLDCGMPDTERETCSLSHLLLQLYMVLML